MKEGKENILMFSFQIESLKNEIVELTKRQFEIQESLQKAVSGVDLIQAEGMKEKK